MNKVIDINYLVGLVQEQEPSRSDLIDALNNCKDGFWENDKYYRYVVSTNANQPGAEWQHSEGIVLEQDSKGDIVIDYLMDGRIGGIEFLDPL